MPYVVNEGAKLYWEEYGSGPPVLLIMGLSFTLEMWFRLLPPLLDAVRREPEFVEILNAARRRHQEFRTRFF
jgi:pimeloyl-ACP methyl ester carboxylesterase